MPANSSPKRSGLHSAWWVVASLLLVAACEELDPVYTIDLCRGNRVYSLNCDVCRSKPYSQMCPQCMSDPDNPDCERINAATTPDGGTPSGGNGGSGTGAANGESGRDSNGVAGSGASAADGGNTSGAGGPAANGGSGSGSPTPGQAGDGPMSGGGGAGTPPEPPPPCGGPCGETRPLCDPVSKQCVQCLGNEHCGDKQCDMITHTCENCVDNQGCPGQYCRTDTHQCVECMKNEECTADPVRDICSVDNKCVDCEGTLGCPTETPACIGQKCYQCADDTQCPAPGPRRCLGTDHICVQCLGDAADVCPVASPHCDVPNLTCVQCLEDRQCTTGHCAAKKCVECEADADCPNAAKSHCANNQCVPCDAQAQCQHLSDTPACDTGAGNCVECINDSTCDGNACVRATHLCSDVPLSTLNPCDRCEADTQCKSQLKCVSMSDGNFCLYIRRDAGGCATSATSAIRPFTTSQAGSSVDGFTGPFCAPSSATCQQFIDARNQKGCMAAACNPGEACLTTADNAFCTYGCKSDVDCPLMGLSSCSESNLCSPP